MNKKAYMKPMSEIVRIGSRRLILDGEVHMPKQSFFKIGSKGGQIGTGNGDADAKYGWDLWDDYQGFDEEYNKW